MSRNATNNSKSTSSVSAKDIEAGIEQVKADLAELSETLATYGRNKSENVKSKISEKSDIALKSTEEKLKELQAQMEGLGSNIENQIRQKPIQSIALAAGIGALIAFLAKK